MLKLANIFVAVAAGSTIAGAISSLGTKKKNEEMSAALAREQLARLNRYLYLGSALMVCGMLLILAWLHWPDFYFSDGDSSYSTLANGLALYFGVNYSLIVFSYYAPVAFVLSQRGRASGRSEPLDLHAIFRVVFALLSPFLTGLFGTVISTVS
jgi:hypothetical protein